MLPKRGTKPYYPCTSCMKTIGGHHVTTVLLPALTNTITTKRLSEVSKQSQNIQMAKQNQY